jgi:hypothetical protein
MVMVAADQLQGTAQELWEGPDLCAQFGGEPQAAMDQIPQHHHLLGLQRCGEIEQLIEIAQVAITGQRDAAGLEAFGFAQM